MHSNRWSKSKTGRLWRPEPTRRTILSGAVSGGVALMLGCGSESQVMGGDGGGGSGGTGSAGTGSAGTGSAGTGGPGGSDGGIDDALHADASPEAAELACTTREEQIVGPYPAPGIQLERSDIRSDPGDSDLVKPGVPLRVVIRVGSKGDASCLPMQGAVVNAWQCDATGQYAGYNTLGTAMNKFLRGYQLTDGSGVVEFQTIYPGSYVGRAVHVHFSVRMSSSLIFPDDAFVGQLYFPDAVTDEVLLQAPYSSVGRISNAQDAYYRDDMLATVSRLGDGWLAQLELAV